VELELTDFDFISLRKSHLIAKRAAVGEHGSKIFSIAGGLPASEKEIEKQLKLPTQSTINW